MAYVNMIGRDPEAINEHLMVCIFTSFIVFLIIKILILKLEFGDIIAEPSPVESSDW